MRDYYVECAGAFLFIFVDDQRPMPGDVLRDADGCDYKVLRMVWELHPKRVGTTRHGRTTRTAVVHVEPANESARRRVGGSQVREEDE